MSLNIRCPNGHQIELDHINIQGDVYACGHCRAAQFAFVHTLPEKDRPKPQPETILPPDLAFALGGVMQAEPDGSEGIQVIQQGDLGQPVAPPETVAGENGGTTVHALAREIGWKAGELVTALQEAGYDVKSHWSKVPVETSDWCRANLVPAGA
jgi:hypothetical protein